MKKSLILSAIVAGLLVGCNNAKDESKKAVEATKEATTHTVEATKEVANKATESVKETAKKAVENAKEATTATVEKAKEVATKAKETVEKKVEEAKAAVAPKADGAKLFVTCAGCHGAKAEKKALGASQVIGGWDAKKIEDALHGYKAGTYGGAMKGVMAGQVAKLDDAKIKALAEYISTLK